jgi:LSD1 subclass zinc finger protein
MLRVACPSCKKPLGLPDNVAGKSVKCPKCQQVFKAPAASAAAAAAKAADVIPLKPVDDEATPYGIREDAPTPEQLRKSAQGEAVDQMVIDAKRAKLRNKAWEKVGTPAKFMKRFALIMCILWIFLYLFLTMIIVLANHNLEAAAKTGGQIMSGGVKTLPKYLFVQDIISELNPQDVPPIWFWLSATGGLIVALTIYGIQLAGAEQMKKLTNYRLCMFAMVIGTLTINLFGIWGLLALMDKQVQYEFRVTARRHAGMEGEAIYDEGEDDEEDEDEEEDEEEEDEEEAAPRARRR